MLVERVITCSEKNAFNGEAILAAMLIGIGLGEPKFFTENQSSREARRTGEATGLGSTEMRECGRVKG